MGTQKKKKKHFIVCIGEWWITNSSMGTHITMNRLEYVSRMGNYKRTKKLKCLYRCIVCQEFINGNKYRNQMVPL